MKTDVAKVDRYPLLKPVGVSDPISLLRAFQKALVFSVAAWMISSVMLPAAVQLQFLCLLVGAFYCLTTHPLVLAREIRSELKLRAKGLQIKDPRFSAFMYWNWLVKVEIRQRTFSIFPNYVYFKFVNGSDVLLLWDDVKESMDSTTLISCVRTWAPEAEILGDVNLSKSESIATYTELWLRDLNADKSDRRTKRDQLLPVGTVLNERYKIERVLSGGGQGTAYLAEVLSLPDLPLLPPQVVVKEFILPENVVGMKKAADGLLKEVAILRRVEHPSVVRLYDFFIEDMRGYFAIEFVQGGTLRQLVSLNGPLAETRVAKLGQSLCEVLSYLHEQTPPIVHGDVTPDNIMLDQDGVIKLLDFDASQELTRNKTNTIVGKHSYMAPEQFKGVLSASGDIYALGCTLHFLLTAQDPAPLQESSPSSIVSSVGLKISKVVSRATMLDATERYSNLDEMRLDLEQV